MNVFAENWKAKCTVCGKEVTFGNWKCEKMPGHHKVAEQVYFHLGGGHLQNWRERRGWSPQMILKAGIELTDPRTGPRCLSPPSGYYSPASSSSRLIRSSSSIWKRRMISL